MATLTSGATVTASDARRGHVASGHLDAVRAQGFNDRVLLFALIASDSDFAVDLFPTRELAEQALADVLADEPTFSDLLTIAAIADELGSPSPN